MLTCKHAGAKAIQAQGSKHCVSQKGNNTAQIYSETHMFTQTHTYSRSGKSRSEACCCLRQGLGAQQLKSRASGEEARCSGLDPLIREGGGCFSSWNTQGLAALTSFNLICIRAVFGGKHGFSLRGDIQGHGKQQQTVDLYPCSGFTGEGKALYSQISVSHTKNTRAHILFPHNYVYIMKSNLSNWNAS